MRKISMFVLAIMMLFGFARLANADVLYTRAPGTTLSTIGVSGSAEATLSTTVGTSNRVLGYYYSDSAAGNVALFDCASAQGSAASTTKPSTSNVFAETDVIAGGNVNVMFPLPKSISNGLVTKNSATTGKLIVYYE